MQMNLEDKLDNVKKFYLKYLQSKKRGLFATLTHRLKDPDIIAYLDLLVPTQYHLFLKFHMWYTNNYVVPKCEFCNKELSFSLKHGFHSYDNIHKLCHKPPFNKVYTNYSQFFGNKDLVKVNYKSFIIRPNINNLVDKFLQDFPFFKSYNSHIFSLFSYINQIEDIDSISFCKICNQNKVFIDLTLLRDKNIIYFKDYCICCTNKVTIEKCRKFVQEKYNVINVSQLDKVKLKKKESSRKKYGTDCVFQSEIIKNKSKQTLLDKYGIDNISKSQEVKDKKEEKILKKFGTWKNYMNYTLEKFCKTRGVNNVSQLQEVKDKKILTFLEHFGVENCFQSEEIKEQSKKTCLEKYNCEFYSQSKNARRLNRERLIKQVEIQYLEGEPLVPTIGTSERECFNFLEDKSLFQILRNCMCIGFFIDGYIPHLNLVIEFDEEFHFDKNGFLLEVDKKRQSEIEDYLNCVFLRISKIEWEKSKENILFIFNESVKKCSIEKQDIKVIFENRRYRIIRSYDENKETN
jgi:hypothetical protein